MRLLSKININKANLEEEFFPFFHVENCFGNELDPSELLRDFPSINAGGSFPTEKLSQGPLKNLIEELEGAEFKSIIEDKFDINLEDAEVITTLRGFSRPKDGQIHTDSKSKIVTVLIYLNPDWNHQKGNLRLLKDNNNLDNYIKEIPSEIGNLVAFKVTANCWHGFKAYEGKRLSIQLNYVNPQSASSHRFRHTISSKIKQILKRP